MFGSTVYHREDGSSAEVRDVALRGEDLVLTEVSAEEESSAEAIDSDEQKPAIKEEPEEKSSETQETTSMDEGTSQPEPEEEWELDEAEINRISQQLQSDAAAGANPSGITGNSTAESIVVVDSTEDEALLLAA